MRKRQSHFHLQKYGIYFVDLPTQYVTVPNHSGSGTLKIAGAEMNGNHPCVVVAICEDGRSATVCPLTSALDSRGGEKFQAIKKEWLRITHQGHPSYVLTEQTRMVDRARFINSEGCLGEFDRTELEKRIKFVFGIV